MVTDYQYKKAIPIYSRIQELHRSKRHHRKRIDISDTNGTCVWWSVVILLKSHVSRVALSPVTRHEHHVMDTSSNTPGRNWCCRDSALWNHWRDHIPSAKQYNRSIGCLWGETQDDIIKRERGSLGGGEGGQRISEGERSRKGCIRRWPNLAEHKVRTCNKGLPQKSRSMIRSAFNRCYKLINSALIQS